MTRRRLHGWLIALVPAILAADERSDAIDLITPLASALSASDAEGFLQHIPKEAPNRSQLVNNIQGLLAQAEITSSVKLLTIDTGRAEIDWYMEIRSRARSVVLERRKGTVIINIRNGSIVALEPVDFFKPAEIG
ncbi:MAG TPA: hypothetical protein VEX68_28360 [Bryobacteraceae bacterium]|nr:hypothetical protein [Bryobacteraceae bacterium]